MAYLSALVKTLSVCFLTFIDWAFGCAHRRTTIPISHRVGMASETYVVCLACGRRFEYDWVEMRITRRRCAWQNAAKKGSL